MASFQLTFMTRRLADLTHSGLPLGRSLEVLARQSENATEKKLLVALHRDIESGKSFSEALARQNGTFTPVYVGLVRAGEASGSFDGVLQELSQLLENEIDAKQRLITATVYPAFLLALAVSVCLFLVSFVIPRFQPLFEEFGQSLPFPTRFLMALAAAVTHFGWLFVIAAGLGLGVAWTRRRAFHKCLSSMVLRLRRFAAPIRSLYLERWAYVMSMLLRHGLTVPAALAMSRQSFGNGLFAAELDPVLTKVYAGHSLATALAGSRLFPPALCEMVAAGEETGELETTFARVASAYRKESDLHRRLVAALLEPALVLGMGGIVGFVALAMLLPLLQMNGSLR